MDKTTIPTSNDIKDMVMNLLMDEKDTISIDEALNNAKKIWQK